MDEMRSLPSLDDDHSTQHVTSQQEQFKKKQESNPMMNKELLGCKDHTIEGLKTDEDSIMRRLNFRDNELKEFDSPN